MAKSDIVVMGDAAGVEFDLSTITAKEMDDFFKAAKVNDQAGLAAAFPRVVKSAPSSWGDLTKPETYLALPYFGAWKALVAAFIDEASGKN